MKIYYFLLLSLYSINALATWTETSLYRVEDGVKIENIRPLTKVDTYLIETTRPVNANSWERCFSIVSRTVRARLQCAIERSAQYIFSEVIFEENNVSLVYEKWSSPRDLSFEVHTYDYSGTKVHESSFVAHFRPTSRGYAVYDGKNVRYCQLNGNCKEISKLFLVTTYNFWQKDFFLLESSAAYELYDADGLLVTGLLPKITPAGEEEYPTEIKRSKNGKKLLVRYGVGVQAPYLVLDLSSNKKFWILPEKEWLSGQLFLEFASDDLLIARIHVKLQSGWYDTNQIVNLQESKPQLKNISSEIQNPNIAVGTSGQILGVIGSCYPGNVCHQLFSIDLKPVSQLHLLGHHAVPGRYVMPITIRDDSFLFATNQESVRQLGDDVKPYRIGGNLMNEIVYSEISGGYRFWDISDPSDTFEVHFTGGMFTQPGKVTLMRERELIIFERSAP